MANPEIEIVSREIIKPSSPTPPHLRTITLSLLDQLSPFYYTPIIFYYHNTHLHKSHTQISTGLKDSLSKTLSQFYPLAGRIKDRATIDCNDEGALFSEARVNCTLSELLSPPKINVLDRFLPCPQYSTVPVDAAVQLAVQMNVFAGGGMAIGMCFFHKVVDGATMAAFLRCWAAISSGESAAVNPDFSASSRLFLPIKSEKEDPFLLNISWLIKQGRGVRRRFVFDGEAISTLKSLGKSGAVPFPSGVEAVSAFLWKHVAAAACPPQRPSMLALAVNLRPRAASWIPENCTGNMIWQGVAHHDEKEEKMLQDWVIQVRNAILKIDDPFIRSLQAENRHEVVEKFREKLEEKYLEVKPDVYMLTSWCKFGFNLLDFGWGKPVWVSNTGEDVSPMFANHVTLVDTVTGDGIEAWVILGEDVMGRLESDDDFRALASLNPNISISPGH